MLNALYSKDEKEQSEARLRLTVLLSLALMSAPLAIVRLHSLYAAGRLDLRNGSIAIVAALIAGLVFALVSWAAIIEPFIKNYRRRNSSRR